MFTGLISVAELDHHLKDPNFVILDARFSLADTGRGYYEYHSAHIPGALYIHLDDDLSGPVIPGKTGRHPLPTPEAAAARFGELGIGDGVQVVIYDDAGGALAAVRAWWMLRWLGHSAAAVLNGGWQAWLERNLATRGGKESRSPNHFTPRPRPELVLTADIVNQIRQDPTWSVGDARAHDRYLGNNETIDPVAGHIPGAISTPYMDNLTPEGYFRTAEELQNHYTLLLHGTPAERVVFYCGSGVTSIHNILAMQVAGLGEARLYPGSWSEWITKPGRPVATV